MRGSRLVCGSIVAVGLLNVACTAPAGPPCSVEGLFASDWRARNAAALALCDAERIDESALRTCLANSIRDGQTHNPPPGPQERCDVLLFRAQDSLQHALWLPEYCAGLIPGATFAPLPLLQSVEDLLVPWTLEQLAVLVVAHRRQRHPETLRLLERAVASGDQALASQALMALHMLDVPWDDVAQRVDPRALVRCALSLSASGADGNSLDQRFLLHVLQGKHGETARFELLHCSDGAPVRSEPRFAGPHAIAYLHELQRMPDVGPYDLDRQGIRMRSVAASTLDSIGPPGAAAIPEYLEFLLSTRSDWDDSDRTVLAVLAVGQMAAETDRAAEAVDALVDLAWERCSLRLQLAIATALGSFAAQGDAQAIAWLNEAVQEPPRRRTLVAFAALQALSHAQRMERVPIERVHELARAPRFQLEQVVLSALARRGAAQTLDALVSREPRFRAAILQCPEVARCLSTESCALLSQVGGVWLRALMLREAGRRARDWRSLLADLAAQFSLNPHLACAIAWSPDLAEWCEGWQNRAQAQRELLRILAPYAPDTVLPLLAQLAPSLAIAAVDELEGAQADAAMNRLARGAWRVCAGVAPEPGFFEELLGCADPPAAIAAALEWQAPPAAVQRQLAVVLLDHSSQRLRELAARALVAAK